MYCFLKIFPNEAIYNNNNGIIYTRVITSTYKNTIINNLGTRYVGEKKKRLFSRAIATTCYYNAYYVYKKKHTSVYDEKRGKLPENNPFKFIFISCVRYVFGKKKKEEERVAKCPRSLRCSTM